MSYFNLLPICLTNYIISFLDVKSAVKFKGLFKLSIREKLVLDKSLNYYDLDFKLNKYAFATPFLYKTENLDITNEFLNGNTNNIKNLHFAKNVTIDILDAQTTLIILEKINPIVLRINLTAECNIDLGAFNNLLAQKRNLLKLSISGGKSLALYLPDTKITTFELLYVSNISCLHLPKSAEYIEVIKCDVIYNKVDFSKLTNLKKLLYIIKNKTNYIEYLLTPNGNKLYKRSSSKEPESLFVLPKQLSW